MAGSRDRKPERRRAPFGSADGDDQPSPYDRPARAGYGLVLFIGLLVACAILAYGAFHRGEIPANETQQPTAGSRR